MKLKLLLIGLIATHYFSWAADVTLQAESMTTGGPYAGTISNPFSGVAFYGNNDSATGNANFSSIPGEYLLEVRGASSSNGADAGISVLVGGVKISSLTFNSATPTTLSATFTLSGGSSNQSVELLLETDNGSSDTFIDWVGFTYQGAPPPPRPAPQLPSQGAFYSGNYRNMFVESGLSSAQVTARYNEMWNQYFVNGSTSNERLYYEVGSDMAYILDTGNDDIRSEGMSYGMMICVQRGDQTRFNRLWKFAKTYSQHPAGTSREGLFSWQVNRNNYSMIDQNSAPDGEEYFVQALFFADARWGSGSGIYNYKAEANYILDKMLDKPAPSTGSCPTALVDQVEKQVVFGICGNSATFTDPSYHLAAFYDYWAQYADNNNQLWTDMANTSRTYLLPNAAHPVTGLMPDYSEFDGTPVNQGNHGNFEYDAWRNIMNMSFDISWYQKNMNSLQPLIDKQIDFFKDKPGYASLWTLDGSYARLNDHSPGLVACNAVASLALEDSKVWPFVDELFTTAIPSGQYRYYDGLLYMMSFMHIAGEYRIYKPGGSNPPPPPSNNPPSANAGPNQTVTDTDNNGSQSVTLNGTGSSDSDGSISSYVWTEGGSQIATGASPSVSLAVGSHTITLTVTDNDGATDTDNVSITVNPGSSGGGQSAYNGPHAIPGTIQAEDYDNGGQGVAYNDATTQNSGNQGRTGEGVDVQNTTDTGGGTNVGWTSNGEWLEYTIGSVSSGTYDITLRVASPNGNSKSIGVTLGGQNLGTANIPNTGGWQNWQDVTLSNVSVSGGSNQVLRLNINTGSFNINYVTFTSTGSNPPPPPPPSGQTAYNGPHAIPGTIQAEDYDNGGQGVAYNDATSQNSGNQGRTGEGVDVQNTSDTGGGTNVGWTSNGEWLEYTIGNVAAGTYNITLRVASPNGNNKSVGVSLDGQNLGTANVPNTGGWQNWQDVTISNVSITGGTNKVLRLTINSGNYNLNYVTFTSSGSNPPPPTGGTIIQAENNDANYYNLTASGGVITNISYSHWLRFDNVDISGGTFTYRYSKGNNDNGYMKVRIDNNNDASNIATIYPPSTGSWNTFSEQTVNISGSGSHTVYLYFHNAGQNIRLDWIRFGNASSKTIDVLSENDALSLTTEPQLSIFPNPSHGDVQLQFQNMKESPDVTVLDLSGRMVLRQRSASKEGMVLEGLSPGLYLVEVITRKGVISRKITIR